MYEEKTNQKKNKKNYHLKFECSGKIIWIQLINANGVE